jgi:hypothetical protein
MPAKAAPNPEADCSRTAKPPASAALLAAVTPATTAAITMTLGEALIPVISKFTTGGFSPEAIAHASLWRIRTVTLRSKFERPTNAATPSPRTGRALHLLHLLSCRKRRGYAAVSSFRAWRSGSTQRGPRQRASRRRLRKGDPSTGAAVRRLRPVGLASG